MSHFASNLARFVQVNFEPAFPISIRRKKYDFGPGSKEIAGYLKSSNRGNVSRSTGWANRIGSDTRIILLLGNLLRKNR